MDFMNPREDKFLGNLDRRKPTRPEEIRAIAERILKNALKVHSALDEIAFNPNTFANLYSAENVAHDLRYVAGRKADFESSSNYELIPGLTAGDIKLLAERVEYEVIRGINMGNWFEGARAYKTSEYDDIANGIDLVLEIVDNTSYGHLGLGIDVTFSQDIEKKLRRIKDEIDRYDGEENRLGRVKYFESSQVGMRGELCDLARAVVAIDLPMLDDMTRVKNDSFQGHISKHIALLEIQKQQGLFLEYAGRKNQKAIPALERSSGMVNMLVEREDSQKRVSQSEYIRNRRADDALVKGLEMFK
jgi:hypothetical protein